ncbi:LD-carboxypeptidase [bacterium]|nr:LD-carboxypeptidase [bacterium]
MYIKPERLRSGDTIGVISPGSPVLPGRLERGIEYLKRSGYSVRLGQHVSDANGYLAGSDKDRTEDIHRMYRDDEVAAIFCTRGGYGTPRLLNRIDYDLIRRNPKIFVGFSDITALQLAILAKSDAITFSGPMVGAEMARDMDSLTERHFWDLIGGASRSLWLSAKDAALKCLRPGKARGPLIGGCLSLICSLVGTPYLPDLTGAILLVEEVGEAPYRIDRLLTQLRLSENLQKLSGILFGKFENCVSKSPDDSLSIEQVIRDATSDLTIPVIYGVSYGHVDQKFTFPMGADIELDAELLSIRIDIPVR